MFSNPQSPRRKQRHPGGVGIGGSGSGPVSPQARVDNPTSATITTASGGGGNGSIESPISSSHDLSAVTASLHPPLDSPYSSLTLSPSRRYAIVAGKDLLRIVRLTDVGRPVSNPPPPFDPTHRQQEDPRYHQRTSNTNQKQYNSRLNNSKTATGDLPFLSFNNNNNSNTTSATATLLPQPRNENEGNRLAENESLKLIRTVKIAQYLSVGGGSGVTGQTSNTAVSNTRRYGDVRDAFSFFGGDGINHHSSSSSGSVTASVVTSDPSTTTGGGVVGGAIKVSRVAWSNYFTMQQQQQQQPSNATSSSSSTTKMLHSQDSGGSGLSTARGKRMNRHNTGTGIDTSIDEFETTMGENMKISVTSSRRHHQQQRDSQLDSFETIESEMDDEDSQSFIAVAGSNGVVAIWNARSLVFPPSLAVGTSSSSSSSISSGRAGGGGRRHESSSLSSTGPTTTGPPPSGAAVSMMTQPPEGILSQHTRPVNALAWHPTRVGLLLTGSQDSTIKVFERKATTVTPFTGGNETSSETDQKMGDEEDEASKRRPWFLKGGRAGHHADVADSGVKPETPSNRTYAKWLCKATFEPRSDAILDIQWSKFQDDTFGVVTSNGNLIVYSMYLTVKALVKISAHSHDATTLDWHPSKPYMVATGGSNDRCVKVWDLEKFLNMEKQHGDSTSITVNSNTWGTTQSTTSTSSTETEKSNPLPSTYLGGTHQQQAAAAFAARSSSGLSGGGGRSKSSSQSKHLLSVSASVTKVRWRPPANIPLSSTDDVSDESDSELDRHHYHIAVATAQNPSVGGVSIISLWSINRPFMPLSVLESHRDGAVSDFLWLQTPIFVPEPKSSLSLNALITSAHSATLRSYAVVNAGGHNVAAETNPAVSCVWQHCLSVGRDGECYLQSFVRGDRPIRRIPGSCFAMTDLSPFQKGYGSLQCFSVYQNVPNELEDDFALTGLRQDQYTDQSPGAFHEPAFVNSIDSRPTFEDTGDRIPSSPPQMIFSVVDQGDLDGNGLPIQIQDDETLCVAPEVIHLSRFARLYKMYSDDEDCHNTIDLCAHNGRVAGELGQIPLSYMWKTVESLLRGCGSSTGGLPPAQTSISVPTNAMQYAILPTVRSILFERADAGDVQTCVVLCEVLQVIEEGGKSTRIPGLQMEIVREWYMSYIDLLHQMCLFTAAAYLIKYCRDPSIGALNQQSTTIHEACPVCGKPLDSAVEASLAAGGTTSSKTNLSDVSVSRRTCRSCRRKVGKCSICQEPVQGLFVWCPGCGHGGCIKHILKWFGDDGSEGTRSTVRQFCPAGCGHKCNLTKMITGSFPRTGSSRNLAPSTTSATKPNNASGDTTNAMCIPVPTKS